MESASATSTTAPDPTSRSGTGHRATAPLPAVLKTAGLASVMVRHGPPWLEFEDHDSIPVRHCPLSCVGLAVILAVN